MINTLLLACFLCATQLTYSQKLISVSGGEATGAGGSSSYSVGQLLYTYHEGAGTVAQGVQQSIELYTLSNHELTGLTLTAMSYPNPVSNYVVLSFTEAILEDLGYAVYDLQGRLLLQGEVVSTRTKINVQGLGKGAHVLKVYRNKQELKTFRIIKK